MKIFLSTAPNEEDSHFVNSLIETKKVLLGGNDILGNETEKPQSSDIISCESYKKIYKTNAGYERHIRNAHKSKSTTPQISDDTILHSYNCPNWEQIYATQQQ